MVRERCRPLTHRRTRRRVGVFELPSRVIDVVIKGRTRFVRSFDLENLADPELSQRRYVVLEGDKSWCCVQHYHQL